MLIGDPNNRSEDVHTVADAMRLLQAQYDERVALAIENHYDKALRSIVRHRGMNGGWPPRDLAHVCGWQVVQIIADIFGKTARQVAQDLIDRSENDEDQ
jgi:hypothetical protein